MNGVTQDRDAELLGRQEAEGRETQLRRQVASLEGNHTSVTRALAVANEDKATLRREKRRLEQWLSNQEVGIAATLQCNVNSMSARPNHLYHR